jgi:hypothetical protein
LVEWLADFFFEESLEDTEAITGIEEAAAGFVVEMHLLIRLDVGEVAEAGGVGKDHARGNPGPGKILDEEAGTGAERHGQE